MAQMVSLLQYKGIQIYNEKASFWMTLPYCKGSWTLGNVLGAKFWLLTRNFICTYLHDGAISVCIHALLGLETLRDRV